MYVYRVSNNGPIGWRPAVQEVQAFLDQSCSKKAEAAYVDESGHLSGSGDGKAAFDGNTGTSWRPQCPEQSGGQCAKNEAWITFSTTEEVQCIIANELGHGSGGGKAWNIGITVELKNCDGTWNIVMQSHIDNSASSETLGIQMDFTIIISIICYNVC